MLRIVGRNRDHHEKWAYKNYEEAQIKFVSKIQITQFLINLLHRYQIIKIYRRILKQYDVDSTPILLVINDGIMVARDARSNVEVSFTIINKKYVS